MTSGRSARRSLRENRWASQCQVPLERGFGTRRAGKLAERTFYTTLKIVVSIGIVGYEAQGQ